MEAETKKIIRVEEEDEIEGKIAETNDYIFDKIGDPVPLKPDGFTFDPQSSPSRPLAVSDKHGLFFAAHSSGFLVAKTKDVMAAATAIKEDKGGSSVSSIEKVSVADVPLADLHILALSTDNSTLAAATAHSDVHFFSVPSLMEKGLEPSFSVSIDESTSIKDMQWTKNSENMYVLLSKLGKLYRGTIGGPLTDVMDDVDAVEWSSKGNLIAVARKDILNILSSKFSQRSSIQLSFKSWIDDSDTHCTMKVDSIRWVRRDSIILGCFQLTADRTEENYVVQVIQIKDGKFTDDSCKPVVIYFNELFSYLVDDIFPPASGPYLLLSYLEECKLAIIANRKNADQHVVYLSWSLGEERNEVVTVDIPRDNLKPRIELQENGDDNVIMGFCVDKVSMSENISVKLEMGHKEFSPYCILIFLTLDGKLVMYHVASVSDITFAPVSVSTVSDEEDDDTALVPLETEPSKFSTQLWKQPFENVDMDVPLGDENIKELVRKVGPDVITKDDLKSLDANVVPNQMLDKGSTKSNEKVVPPTIEQSFRGQQEDLFAKFYPDRNVKQVQLSGQENKNMQHRSTEASTCEMEPAGLQSSGKITPSKGDFTVSDEEDDDTALVPLETEPSKFSTQLGKQPFENFDMDVPLDDENIKELVRKVGPDVITKDDLKSLDANVVPNQMQDKGSTKSNEKVVPPTIAESFRSQQEVLFPKVYPDRNVKQVQLSGQENRNMQHRSTEASTREMEPAGLQSSGTITPSKGIDVNSSTVPSIFGSRSANASQLVGFTGGYGQPFNKKDISGTSPAVNFSGMLFENKGRPATTAGNIVSVPSISSSHMSSQESVALGKALNQKVHPLKENYSDSFSRRLNSESKQFGNISDMTKELDMFLQSIEEAGGFRDACIVDQKSSVEELEREVGSLSERCQMWKNTINERLHEVQHLFDMTVQVLARKIYMEGIVKQASDSRYWEFWSCQKLSSELELKRRRISKMNQDLTDQLIQLERHFNGLELNKFGDNEGAHAGRRASQTRCGPSRHVQSLHSLHSTMTSQLAAADQLSECLSKQMATLRIESPTLKQKNVKKELFETIGIPYDASFSSPSSDLTKFSSTPKDKVLFSLGSSAAKEQPRRNASATKNYEPETARRRRDSLDRSWANYEPTKATVKRLLLQESGKATVSRSSLSVDKQRFSSRLMDGSAATRPRDRTMPATFMHPLENEEGIKDTHAKQEKSVFPSESSQKPSSFMFPTQKVPLNTKPSDILNSYPNESAHPTEDSVKAGSLKATFATVEAGKKHDSPFSLKFPVSVAPNLPGKSSQLFGTTSKSRPVDMSPSAQFSVSASSSSMFSSSSGPLPSISSSASPTLSSVMSLNSSMASFIASADLSIPLSTSPLSARSSPTVFPSGSFSLNASKAAVPSSDTSTVTNSASETPKINLNANTMPPMESGPSAAETKLKPEPSISSPLTVEISTGLASQSSLGNASPASALAPESQPSFKNTASPAPAVEPESQPGFKNTASPAPAVAPESQKSFKNTASAAPAVEPESQPSFKNTASPAPAVAPEIQNSFKNTVSPAPAVAPESQHSFKNTASPTPTVTINAQKEQPSAGKSLFPIALSNSGSVTGGLDVQNTQEDDMDEEAPDTSSTAELSLGILSAFGLGSSNNPTTAKPNPFGGSFVNPDTSMTTSPFGPRSMTSGELFQPASFNFQSPQPSQSSQPANSGFAGGFGTSMNAQAPTPSGFSQPTQVGPGQQALGSVLGAFGQSRQIGTGLPGTGFGSPSGFGGGVAGTNSPGGFSGAATGGFAGATSTVGGFAAVASGSGGFASLASGGGGFGGAASGGGGFGGAASVGGGFGGAAAGGGGFGGAAASGGGFGGAGGGFAGAAPNGTGFPGATVAVGGFGGFGGQQQAPGGFSAFGSGGATGKPSQLFTQMRK